MTLLTNWLISRLDYSSTAGTSSFRSALFPFLLLRDHLTWPHAEACHHWWLYHFKSQYKPRGHPLPTAPLSRSPTLHSQQTFLILRHSIPTTPSVLSLTAPHSASTVFSPWLQYFNHSSSLSYKWPPFPHVPLSVSYLLTKLQHWWNPTLRHTKYLNIQAHIEQVNTEGWGENHTTRLTSCSLDSWAQNFNEKKGKKEGREAGRKHKKEKKANQFCSPNLKGFPAKLAFWIGYLITSCSSFIHGLSWCAQFEIHWRNGSQQKARHFANKGPYSQSYGFSSSHVRMWELNLKED